MIQNIEIEEVLRSHGITRSLWGFEYLKEALRLAEEGVPVGPALLVQTAEHFQRTKSVICRSIRTALNQMFDLPEFSAQKPEFQVYEAISFLFREVQMQQPRSPSG